MNRNELIREINSLIQNYKLNFRDALEFVKTEKMISLLEKIEENMPTYHYLESIEESIEKSLYDHSQSMREVLYEIDTTLEGIKSEIKN